MGADIMHALILYIRTFIWVLGSHRESVGGGLLMRCGSVRPTRRRMYHVSMCDAEKLKTAFFIQALINGKYVIN